MRVVHFQRKALPGVYFSVETVFAVIRAELHGVDVVVHESPRTNRGTANKAVNAVAARRHGGEVNHITGDNYYLAWSLPSARTVLTVLDCGWEERLTGWRRRAVTDALLRGPVRRSAVVTVPSTFTRDRVRALSGADAEIVPLCISPAFTPTERAVDSPPTILTVGTLPNKNLGRIIDAVAGIGARLHLVGVLSDDQRAQLGRSGVEWRNSSRLTDAQLRDAYASADVLGFASTYEGFGMPILEAQSVGCPVLTSDVASMPETAGAGACLVDPLDVASIRAGLTRVLSDAAYRADLIAAGRDNVTRFSPAKSAAQFAEVYRRVAGGNVRR